ncbi:hypothetical protein H4R18_003286 [Coemansia javaensis]|uniref:Uncharacterized protein n=1 Tax=Coemansia javaensis TaxID=2761396 RepID=A0A9W8LHX2_9FUNG|nr:hypothetical protein H4R18_003286 [Coemansia javaensis]
MPRHPAPRRRWLGASRPEPDAKRPLAIISVRGPSVLSAALAPPRSRLRRAALLARNPRIPASPPSDADADSDNGGGAGPKRRRRRSRVALPAADDVAPSSLLVADIRCARAVEDVRRALEATPGARCLVEFAGDGQSPCIMTLYEDGFVWNQEAFLDRRSGCFDSVARRNPFMRSICSSSSSSAGAGAGDASSEADGGGPRGPWMVQAYATAVHEIRDEDCPRLF